MSDGKMLMTEDEQRRAYERLVEELWPTHSLEESLRAHQILEDWIRRNAKRHGRHYIEPKPLTRAEKRKADRCIQSANTTA